MNDDLPSKIPPPPHPKLAGPRPRRPPTTRIPRVFNVWGTLAYGVFSITAFASMIAHGFGWTLPWFIILPSLCYTGISAGIIATGRMQSNKDARFSIQALKRQSEENKRAMRRMN
jgi:hypothetical protein